jgi:hypothetical protein
MLHGNSTIAPFLWISIELRLREEISNSAATIRVIGTREVMLRKYKMEQVAPALTADKLDISLANAHNDEPNHELTPTFDKLN